MNSTDIVVVCFNGDEECILQFNADSGIPPLLLVSDGEMCGGTRVSSMEMYGSCVRCLSSDEILNLIQLFRALDWVFPELASLTINCDSNEELSGVYTLT